jgi:hypothetical protein
MHYDSYEFSEKKVQNFFESKIWEDENAYMQRKPLMVFGARAMSGPYRAEIINNLIWYENGNTSKGNSYSFSSKEEAKSFWETFVKVPIIFENTPHKYFMDIGKTVKFEYNNVFRYGVVTNLQYSPFKTKEILYEVSFYVPGGFALIENRATISRKRKELNFLD